MSTSGPGEAGNPFQFLFGDLMNMLGTGGPGQWETTRAFGLQVATGGTAESNVDPIQRIRLEELARVAELHVIESTGMPVSADGRRISCIPVGRGDWTVRALEAWRPTLTAMTPPQPPSPGTVPPSADPTAGSEDVAGMLAQWANAIGPLFFGLQLGSVVGHLAHRATGQYALAIPWPPSDDLVVVTSNVTSFAADWSLPAEEAILWVCARELASHTVLGRPPIRAHIDGLLHEVAASSAATQQGLMERLSGLATQGSEAGMDVASLQGLLDDPEALLGDLLAPEADRSSARLTALTVVIDAYADHVADLVGRTLVGSHQALAEAWYRRRIERGKGEEAAGALFGLDLEQAQVDRGRAFVSGVVERAGEEALARLWTPVSNLPTPSEVDAPGLWLERISLPKLDQPPGD